MRARSAIDALRALGLTLALATTEAGSGEILYAAEGNRLHRIEVASIDSGSARHEVVIERAARDPARGRDVNGMVCALPDGSGRLVLGEDTGQPNPPAGWGVFESDGTQVGRLVASASADTPDPYGCAFDAAGRLFTTEIGDVGLGRGNGQLILWFPPYDRFPAGAGATSPNACKIATNIGTAMGVAIDAAGRVYVASSSRFRIERFLPPFPSGVGPADGCAARDATGAPMATEVRRETFARAKPASGLLTYSGLAFAPNGNLYAASVATGRIGELDPEGRLVRMVLVPKRWRPPFATGTPQGLAVDSSGRLYYADLALRWKGASLVPGPGGKVWRISFPNGRPGVPEPVLENLEYPDGLGIVESP